MRRVSIGLREVPGGGRGGTGRATIQQMAVVGQATTACLETGGSQTRRPTGGPSVSGLSPTARKNRHGVLTCQVNYKAAAGPTACHYAGRHAATATGSVIRGGRADVVVSATGYGVGRGMDVAAVGRGDGGAESGQDYRGRYAVCR